jgi:hypothetical protein
VSVPGAMADQLTSYAGDIFGAGRPDHPAHNAQIGRLAVGTVVEPARISRSFRHHRITLPGARVHIRATIKAGGPHWAAGGEPLRSFALSASIAGRSSCQLRARRNDESGTAPDAAGPAQRSAGGPVPRTEGFSTLTNIGPRPKHHHGWRIRDRWITVPGANLGTVTAGLISALSSGLWIEATAHGDRVELRDSHFQERSQTLLG